MTQSRDAGGDHVQGSDDCPLSHASRILSQRMGRHNLSAVLLAESSSATGVPPVFAATGAGRLAARDIQLYLSGKGDWGKAEG